MNAIKFATYCMTCCK